MPKSNAKQEAKPVNFANLERVFRAIAFADGWDSVTIEFSGKTPPVVRLMLGADNANVIGEGTTLQEAVTDAAKNMLAKAVEAAEEAKETMSCRQQDVLDIEAALTQFDNE